MAVERVVQPLQEEVSMDWEKTGQFLLALIGGVGGYKMFELLKNWRTDSRKEQSSAEKQELDTLREHIGWLEARLKEKSDRVEELEEGRFEMLGKMKDLEIRLKDAEHNECVRPDDECLRRMPPRMYCRLKRLANGHYDDCYEEDSGVSEEPDKVEHGGKQ